MKAGIFSIGLDTYWPQFDGLLDNLNGYHAAPVESSATQAVSRKKNLDSLTEMRSCLQMR